MSKENIERYIPRALMVLSNEFSDGKIKKTYVGYISAFGVSLVQIGLLPTVAFHEKDEREIINQLVWSVLDPTTTETGLLVYAVNHDDKDALKEKLKDIAVALKFGMRTFELTGGGDE